MDGQQRAKAVMSTVQELAAELQGGRELQVGRSTHLEWDLGLASIERGELLTRLEATLGESLPAKGVFEAMTVADLLALVPGAKIEGPVELPVSLAQGSAPPYPVHAKDLVEALLYQARHQGERVSLVFLEDGDVVAEWSYRTLLGAARRAAGGLIARGVKAGDRVGVMLATGTDYVAIFYGILLMGAIPVPLYPPFRLDQLEDYLTRQASILDVAGVELLISFHRAHAILPLLKKRAHSLREVVEVDSLYGDELEDLRPGEVGLIQFTSGSTGLPKGVMLTQRALLHNMRAYGYGMQLGPEDVTISWLPLYHDMGLIGTLLGSVYHGQPLVLMGPQDFLARPSRWLWALHRYRGTVSPAPNFAYEICARRIPDAELEGLDLSSWRIALNGAEAVRPDTLRRFSERFAAFGFSPKAHFPAYGLAEASLAVTFPPLGRGVLIDRIEREALEHDGVAVPCVEKSKALEFVSCGRTLPEMEVRILGDDGQVLGERHRGHLEFRGPSALACYYANPEATRAIKNEAGWVKTGDLAYLCEGELYLTGRSKDLIVIAGRNLHPEDVEAVVSEVPGVRRGCVAALGVIDEAEGTESLVVVAEARCFARPQDAEALQTRISQELMKRLGLASSRVIIAAPHSVPKTPSGKIRRAETKSRLIAGRLNPIEGWGRLRLSVQLATGWLMSSFAQLLGAPRRVGRSVWCHSCLLGCLAAPQVVSLVSRSRARHMLRPLAAWYLKVTGVLVRVEGGIEFEGPFIVVANHQSSLDPVVLCAALPCTLRFLVAPWVADHVVFRSFISRFGYLPVRRGNTAAALEQQHAIEALSQTDDRLCAFPEGGIEPTPGLRPFALGVFKAAQTANLAVVPVAIRGTRRVQPWPRTEPYSGEVVVRIGAPLYAVSPDWAGLVDLTTRARSFIGQFCGDPLSTVRMHRHD